METNKKVRIMAQVFRIYDFQILSVRTDLANLIMATIKMLFVNFARRNSVSVLWEIVLFYHMQKEDYTFQEYQFKLLYHSF